MRTLLDLSERLAVRKRGGRDGRVRELQENAPGRLDRRAEARKVQHPKVYMDAMDEYKCQPNLIVST